MNNTLHNMMQLGKTSKIKTTKQMEISICGLRRPWKDLALPLTFQPSKKRTIMTNLSNSELLLWYNQSLYQWTPCHSKPKCTCTKKVSHHYYIIILTSRILYFLSRTTAAPKSFVHNTPKNTQDLARVLTMATLARRPLLRGKKVAFSDN